MKSTDPSKLIDKQIADLTDRRGKMLAKLRRIIHDADPGLTEDWKWGTAVWSHKGLVLAVGALKETGKVNFFEGATLSDPNKIFNAGLVVDETRAINFHDVGKMNMTALRDLVRAAQAHNCAG